MNENEKIQFVTELCDSIAAEIIKNMNKIPDEWDGIELRWLVQNYATTRYGTQNKKRKREFDNTVVVNNL